MSNEKVSNKRNTESKCGSNHIEKMKSGNKSVCGCKDGGEFTYDNRFFDCRNFGLFLRKKSTTLINPVLVKLNAIEFGLFRGNLDKTGEELKTMVDTILSNSGVNINSTTKQFITDYIFDGNKNKDNYNRYQIMATLQDTINNIETSPGDLNAVFKVIEQWVSESKRILRGERTRSTEKMDDIIKRHTPHRDGHINNIRSLETQLETSEKSKLDEFDKYNSDKIELARSRIHKLRYLLDFINKNLDPNDTHHYFTKYEEKLDTDYKSFKNSGSKKIIYPHLSLISYTSDTNMAERPFIDIFFKILDNIDEDKIEKNSTLVEKISGIESRYTKLKSTNYKKYGEEYLKKYNIYINNLLFYLITSPLVTKKYSDDKYKIYDIMISKIKEIREMEDRNVSELNEHQNIMYNDGSIFYKNYKMLLSDKDNEIDMNSLDNKLYNSLKN